MWVGAGSGALSTGLLENVIAMTVGLPQLSLVDLKDVFVPQRC